MNKKYTLLASIFALLIIIVIGTWSTIYIGNKIDNDERSGLLLRAGTISKIIDQDKIKDLSGTSKDIDNKSYQYLKTILENVHNLNTDSRFVYLMGLRDNKQFFYVDSEDPSSKDYSPPGQPYADATPTDIYNHINAIAYTNGPYSDEWGKWISAYAPVIDKDTGQVLALVGIDVDANSLLSKISTAREVTFVISFLIFLAILLLIIIIQRSMSYRENLEKVNQDLSIDKDYLIEVEHIARLGQLTWSATTNGVLINQIVMDLIWSKHSKISLETLLEYVNADDITRIKKEISNMKSDASFVTFKYRINSPDQKEHSMVSLCKLKRDSKGAILRAVCTAQDISDNL